MPDAAPAKAIPLLKYSLSNPRHRDYGCITADGKVLHRVSDVYEFYAALGYTQEIRKRNFSPDEFIWDRYTRDGAIMSRHCIQAHIATFLHKYSQKFVEQFGHAYAAFIGMCNLDCIDGNDPHCANCSRHPQQV